MANSYKFDGEDIEVDKLPKPTGWRVLIGKARIEKMGSIILPDDVQKYIENGLTVVKVLAMGPLCFDDDKYRGANPKKPIEPWYQVGDTIIIGKHVGQNLKWINPNTSKVETLMFINDDEVIALLPSLDSIVI